MTYQSPFTCMENCAQGQCRNRTTGCQGECQVRLERAAIVKRLRDMLDHEAADRIAELERQNAELRKDAERYRQLRNKSALQFEHPIVVSQHHEVGEGMRYMGPVIDRELDRLVDYAIAADQKGKAS